MKNLNFKEILKEDILKSLNKLNLEKTKEEIIIEIPKTPINGNYSTNIALALASELKKSPREIANAIKMNFSSNIISKVEVAGPGFINFFINKECLYDVLNEILDKKKIMENQI